MSAYSFYFNWDGWLKVTSNFMQCEMFVAANSIPVNVKKIFSIDFYTRMAHNIATLNYITVFYCLFQYIDVA